MSSSLTLLWLQSDPFDMEQCIHKLDTLVTVSDADGKTLELPSNRMKLDLIFDWVQGRKSTRIYLQDSGGFLSTMTLLELCRSWSFGHGPAVIFDLVVYLDGRELAKNNLDKLIVRRCQTEGVSDEAVLTLIKGHPKVLLILDELSPADLGPGQSSALNQTLKGTKYEDCTILVSFRKSNWGNSPRYALDDGVSPYVTCITPGCCTKVINLYQLQLPITTLPDLYSTNAIETKLKKYHPFVDIQNPIYFVLLSYVYSRKGFPQIVGPQSPLYMCKSIFARLFNLDESKLYNFNKNCIPYECDLLSQLGDYILRNLASQNSGVYTRKDLEKHFQLEDFQVVIKLGFVVINLQYTHEIRVEKLQPSDQSMLEFVIAYHLAVVYKTQGMEPFLQKLDFMNDIKPLEDKSSDGFCRTLAELLHDFRARHIYYALSGKRAQYRNLLLIINRNMQLCSVA